MRTVLTVIQNTGWVTGVAHNELILTLGESYGMHETYEIEAIIRQCLNENLISVRNGRKYNLTPSGHKWLQEPKNEILRKNYIDSAYRVYNPTKKKEKVDWSKWASIATVAGTVIALAGLVFGIYQYQKTQQNSNTTQQNNNQEQHKRDTILHKY